MLLNQPNEASLAAIVASRRLLFFGGKGGVGKTTSASAIALAAAEAGRRVLLVSTDPAHNLGHLWKQKVGPEPVTLGRENLFGVEIDPDATAKAHLDRVGNTLRRLMPEQLHSQISRYLRLSAQAPGAHEAAILERMADLVQTGLSEFDLVIFDTAPSGHTARLMSLPESMSAWTEALLDNRRRAAGFGQAQQQLEGSGLFGGRDDAGAPQQDHRAQRDQRIRHLLVERREKLTVLRDRLRDASLTAFVVALAAERLPVMETIELRAQLAEVGVEVAALIINKRSPIDEGKFLELRCRSEEEWLEFLRAEIPAIPMVQLPLLTHEPVGPEGLTKLAEFLLA